MNPRLLLSCAAAMAFAVMGSAQNPEPRSDQPPRPDSRPPSPAHKPDGPPQVRVATITVIRLPIPARVSGI